MSYLVTAKLIDHNLFCGATIVEAARTCYDSHDKSNSQSDERLVKHLIESGHHAMLEFGWACFYVRCSRVVSHELVRHRLFSYAMRSQRYVNESEAEAVYPPEIDDCPHREYARSMYDNAMKVAWDAYTSLINSGVQKQIARYVLPNGTMTELLVAGNYREWRHFCELRTTKKAQPEMRELATIILKQLKELAPNVFDDIPLPSNVQL